MSVIDKLVVQLGVKVDRSSFAAAQNSLKNLQDKMKDFGGVAGAAFGAFLGSRLFNELTGIAKQSVILGAKLETTEKSMSLMVGNAEKTKILLKDIQLFAEKTPFQADEMREYSKSLIMAGFEANKIVDTMTVLGNIAAGVGKDKLPQIVYALKQIKTAGVLRGQEAMQLMNADLPIYEMLAQTTGIKKESLVGDIARHKLSFDTVMKSMVKIQSEGIKVNGVMINYKGLMDEISKTTEGKWSNIQDVITNTMETAGRSINNKLLPYLKALEIFLSRNRETIKNVFMVVLPAGILLTAAALSVLGLAAIGAAAPLVKAGFAVMIAWAPLLLKFMLIGAAIAAVGLIIQDVYKTFTDPTAITVTRELWNSFFGWFENKWIKFKSWYDSITSRAGHFLGVNNAGIFGASKFTGAPDASMIFGAPSTTNSVGSVIINTASTDPKAIYNEFQNRLSNELGMTF